MKESFMGTVSVLISESDPDPRGALMMLDGYRVRIVAILSPELV